jgi:hypothetical protein
VIARTRARMQVTPPALPRCPPQQAARVAGPAHGPLAVPRRVQRCAGCAPMGHTRAAILWRCDTCTTHDKPCVCAWRARACTPWHSRAFVCAACPRAQTAGSSATVPSASSAQTRRAHMWRKHQRRQLRGTSSSRHVPRAQVEALSEEDRQTVVWTQEWERSHGALQARDSASDCSHVLRQH